jgi:sigma-E factor negative regulatory protein RseC
MYVVENGEVVQLKNDIAIVKLQHSAACRQCGICWMAGADTMETEAKNLANAKVGDKVLISVEPNSLLRASFVLYIVPLLFLIVGYLIGIWWAKIIARGNLAEVFGIAFACVFLVFSYFFIRGIDKRLVVGDQFYPVVKSVVK